MSVSHVERFAPTHKSSRDLPWTPFTPYSDQVFLQLFHVDFVRGSSQLMLRAPGGAGLGVHDHYGALVVYTVQGEWHYEEHDWTSKPGDFVYEVANSKHTFVADPGDDVVLFISIEGAIAFLGEDGEVVGIETAHTFAQRYEDYCNEHGLEIVDLTQFSRS